jgi:predicted solute-binding protein
MNAKELAKVLSEKGLTPEQIAKIVERWEKQKERIKKYQKEKYYKVSVTVRKEVVKEVSNRTGIPESIVKKYLAGLKVIRSISQDQRNKIKEVLSEGTENI